MDTSLICCTGGDGTVRAAAGAGGGRMRYGEGEGRYIEMA
jgi:diacylglycerol kinase family enzyme